MKELAIALNAAMAEIDGVEKNMIVGTGSNSYKAVSDKDVKNKVRTVLQRNGLTILPTKVDAKVTIERWVEDTQYGPKSKQQVFTEVNTTYVLLHISGEMIELAGYGQGVDPQDKGAGKSTTYALKTTLLNLLLIPTGEIDDTDGTHSDALPTPVAATTTPVAKTKIPKAREVAKLLRACKTLDELKDTFLQLTNSEQVNFAFVKDEMKIKLTPAVSERETELRSAGDLDTLSAIWKSLTPEEQVIYKEIKDEHKNDLLAVEEIQANLQGEAAQ